MADSLSSERQAPVAAQIALVDSECLSRLTL